MKVRSGLIACLACAFAYGGANICAVGQGGDASNQDAAATADVQAKKPVPDASGVYRAGHGVKPPRVITSVNPQFTDQARRHKISATCLVGLVVDASGKPTDIQILRSAAASVSPEQRGFTVGLDQNAMAAIRKYRFEPGTVDGEPVPVRIAASIVYKIY